jgi:uncharacterized protein (TIGR03083 family)
MAETSGPSGLDYVQVLAAEGAALIAAVEQGPLDASVAACPGWDLVALSGHIGTTWRWATQILNERLTSPGTYDPPTTLAPHEAVGWLQEGLVPLLDAVRSCPPDTPVWGFGPQPRVAAFWARRQAMETVVHRVDAELAIVRPARIEARIAANGVGEFIEVMLPRLYYKSPPPPGQFVVTATDTGDTWALGDPAGEAGTLSGPAEDLLLELWQRGHSDAVVGGGNLDVLAAWRALGAP